MNAVNTDPFTGPCFPLRNRIQRALWQIAYVILFRPSPRPLHSWRRFLLGLFGAQLGKHCHIYPRAVIWAPWNLVCGEKVGIANDAEIYNPSVIAIGDRSTISQGAYLCGASHDYTKWSFPLVTKPITVGKHAWIAARAIVHMGVTIPDGCVIGAGSIVTHDMPPWSVCVGNPCRMIKRYQKDDVQLPKNLVPERGGRVPAPATNL